MSPIRFRSTGRDTVAKKTKKKRGNENSMVVVSACQSHTLFGIHVCAFVYILIPLDCCHLHIQSCLIPIGSTCTVPVGKYMAHISPPLGQNRNWSISDSHLESGDHILLGIVSRRRHTQPCYQSWGIIKQHFCPLSSSRGAF